METIFRLFSKNHSVLSFIIYQKRNVGNRKILSGEAAWIIGKYQSPVFVLVKVRSLDVEKAGKDVDEDLADPGCHLVGLWTPEMNVQH